MYVLLCVNAYELNVFLGVDICFCMRDDRFSVNQRMFINLIVVASNFSEKNVQTIFCNIVLKLLELNESA